MPTQANANKLKLQLTLPESLYDKYAERAAKVGHTPEAEMASRLTKCQDHVSVTPLFVNDEQRNRLNIISGMTINTPDELINWAYRLSRIRVQGVEITLNERVLSRIDSRRFGSTLADTIKKMVTESLEEKVGLR